MANYFFLELNTLPPNVTVAPRVMKTTGVTEIKIKADEVLDTFQEIYIIDSLNVRHDIVFDYNIDEFNKQVDFHGFPLGTANIYIRIRDEVDNETLVVKSIFIGTYSVVISIEEPDVNMEYETKDVDMEVGK